MREFLISVLGVYTPVSYAQSIYDAAGTLKEVVNVIPAGLAGVDWLYVLSGLLLIVVVYALFRALGGLICRAF